MSKCILQRHRLRCIRCSVRGRGAGRARPCERLETRPKAAQRRHRGGRRTAKAKQVRTARRAGPRQGTQSHACQAAAEAVAGPAGGRASLMSERRNRGTSRACAQAKHTTVSWYFTTSKVIVCSHTCMAEHRKASDRKAAPHPSACLGLPGGWAACKAAKRGAKTRKHSRLTPKASCVCGAQRLVEVGTPTLGHARQGTARVPGGVCGVQPRWIGPRAAVRGHGCLRAW